MYLGYDETLNYLDHIRRRKGIDQCKDFYRNLASEHRQNAVRLINDRRLYFASLFILQPEINELGLELNERNQTALDLCKKISAGKETSQGTEIIIQLNSEPVHRALLWMLNTGAADDGLGNEFDQAVDTAAAVLLKTHHEESVIPVIADLIFQRNRRGSYCHDLVWTFFQSRNINSLRYIAKYLRSSNTSDVQLARKLLNLPQDTESNAGTDRENEYRKYLFWLHENAPYLYFTGESLQYSNNPDLCRLDLEAKYLRKTIDSQQHKPIVPYTQEELNCLKNFDEIKEDEKSTLANYSQTLYRKNHRDWNQWIHSPVDKQLHIARYGRRTLI